MAVHLSKTVALVSDVTFCLLDFIGTECLFFIKNTFKFSYVYVRTYARFCCQNSKSWLRHLSHRGFHASSAALAKDVRFHTYMYSIFVHG